MAILRLLEAIKRPQIVIQGSKVVTYVYEIVDGEVTVQKSTFEKS